MSKTPVSLLARLKQPEEQHAWQRFVAMYTPLLYHWARRLGLQEADAGDLVQDVFLILCNELPEFNYTTGRSFHGWLRTVVNNKFRERCRRQAIAVATEANLPEPVVADGVVELTEAEYRCYLLQRALNLMQADFQPTTWKACWETVVEGKAPANVARELGVSVRAVYLSRLRVLARLREELDGLVE